MEQGAGNVTSRRKRTGSPEWVSLGKELEARRTELDPAYFDRAVFAKARNINLKLAQDIERNARENFTPLTLRDIIAPAYGVTYESIRDAVAGGELAAAEGTPPRRPRDMGQHRAEPALSPLAEGLARTPGMGAYLTEVAAERDGGHMTDDEDELRIWANPRIPDRDKHVLVAYMRLLLDKGDRSERQNAGLSRSFSAAL